jgi:DNA ligase-4
MLNIDISPDVYVKDAKKSLILEVKASEIIKSDNFIGYSLRFPRLMKIRNDKCY